MDKLELRDWFAMHAPPSHWGFEQADYADPQNIVDWSSEAMKARNEAEAQRDIEREARWRYRFADAMLAARTDSKAVQP